MDLSRLRIPKGDSPAAAWRAGRVVLVSAAAGLVAGFAAGRLSAGRAGGGPIEVDTVMVGAAGGAAAPSFTAGGWIEVPAPHFPVHASSLISQRLDELNVAQGEAVRPGQVLARLYDGDARARRDAAAAQAAGAAERLRIAGANRERAANLPAGALSVEERDELAAAWSTAASAHDAALAALDLASNELAYCTITAPPAPDGLKVLAVHHAPGEWIAVDRNPTVVSLYAPSNMQMRVDVPQAKIRLVQPGNPVAVRTEAHPSREYRGTVLRVEPLAEAAKNTITVRLRIDNPDEMLFPEMVAHATFLSGRAAAGRPGEFALPLKAVRRDGEGAYVLLVEDGRARRRPVTLRQTTDSAAVVGGGLSAGQRVITSHADGLPDGREVITR